MFELDLEEMRPILNSLLSVNTSLYFTDGMVASLHKHGMCLVCYKDKVFDVEGETINDMSVLSNVLGSKTITSVEFSPEEGILTVRDPYKWVPPIPRLQNKKYISDVAIQLKNLKSLKKAKGKWKDRYGKTHKICKFTVKNIELSDAIWRLGRTQNLQIRTGKSIRITNMKNKEFIVLPFDSKPKVRIYLSEDGRVLFLNSLTNDEALITIANKRVMLVQSDLDMVLAGRIPE